MSLQFQIIGVVVGPLLTVGIPPSVVAVVRQPLAQFAEFHSTNMYNRHLRKHFQLEAYLENMYK